MNPAQVDSVFFVSLLLLMIVVNIILLHPQLDEYVSTNLFHTGGGVKISGVDAAIAGSISGLAAQTLTTPLDVARTRIMTRKSSPMIAGTDRTISVGSTSNAKQSMESKNIENGAVIASDNDDKEDDLGVNSLHSSSSLSSSMNIFTVMRGLVATEGVSSLFRGILPRAARAIGSGAIQFASYELTQNVIK